MVRGCANLSIFIDGFGWLFRDPAIVSTNLNFGGFEFLINVAYNFVRSITIWISFCFVLRECFISVEIKNHIFHFVRSNYCQCFQFFSMIKIIITCNYAVLNATFSNEPKRFVHLKLSSFCLVHAFEVSRTYYQILYFSKNSTASHTCILKSFSIKPATKPCQHQHTIPMAIEFITRHKIMLL